MNVLKILVWFIIAKIYITHAFSYPKLKEPVKIVKAFYKESVLKSFLLLSSVFFMKDLLTTKSLLIFIAGFVTMNSVFLFYRHYVLWVGKK
jgi:hypothetical protein